MKVDNKIDDILKCEFNGPLQKFLDEAGQVFSKIGCFWTFCFVVSKWSSLKLKVWYSNSDIFGNKHWTMDSTMINSWRQKFFIIQVY